jgi:hypothetical protein
MALSRYLHLLSTRPLLTKACTGFVFSGLGDLLAQRMEKKPHESFSLDARRFGVFSLFGAFWTGPVNHRWLPILHSLSPARTLTSTAKKTLVQQLLWNPVAFLPAFYCAYGLGYGMTPAQVWDKAGREYPSTLVACWQIWFPSSFFALMFPERYQSVIMALMNLAWNARLSFESSRHARGQQPVAEHVEPK